MGISNNRVEVARNMAREGDSIAKRHAILLSLNEVGMRMALKAHAEACQAFIKFLTFGEIVAIGACMLEGHGLNELANKFERSNLGRYIGDQRLSIATPKGVMNLNNSLSSQLTDFLGSRVMLKEIVTLGLYEVITARDVEIRATSICVARLTKRGKRLATACG